MDEDPAGAAVAVGERMDGLELGVGDGRLHEGGHVRAPQVGEEVIHPGPQAFRVGRDELRRVRRGCPSPDPPLHVAVGARAGMLLTVHEGTMGGQQGGLVQVGSQPGSSAHGPHVRRHERCVRAGAFAESRQGEGSRARRDVLDLRGGRGLSAQEHRVDRRDLSSEPREGVADLGVEAHDGGRRLLDLGRQIGGQVEPESGDTGWERGSIRARRARPGTLLRVREHVVRCAPLPAQFE